MTDIPDSGNGGLHFLYDIIKDEKNIHRDATTQTRAVKYQLNTGTKSTFKKKYPSRQSKSPKNIYSSFRLFIVPDEENSRDLKYSVETDEDNSCRISIETPEHTKLSKVVNPTEKHDSYSSKKPQDGKERSLKQQTGRNLRSPTGNQEGVQFTSDHWLRETSNPSLLAWLKLKNFEEKQKRKTKRQQKREMRKVASDEAEMLQRRKEESATKYTKWLADKKREERRVMKLTRAHRKISAVGTTKNESGDVPPANYTVIPTFKGTEAWTEVLETTENKVTPVTEENSPKPRPKTSISRRSKTRRLKNRPKTSSLAESETSKLSITYEDWMKRKRVESKEKAKQEKREVVDEALTAGILRMARKRIEHIYEKPKQVDTGLPKWREKHRDKVDEETRVQNEALEEIKNLYSLPDCPKPSGEHGSKNACNEQSISEEIETIRNFCENVDLNTTDSTVQSSEHVTAIT